MYKSKKIEGTLKIKQKNCGLVIKHETDDSTLKNNKKR